MVVAAIRMTRPPTAIGAAENTDLQLNLVSILAWAHRLGPQLLTLVREAVLSWPHPPFVDFRRYSGTLSAR